MIPADVPVSAATVPVLLEVLRDPASSIGEVAEVVGSDAGLAARVLAVANSAAFGRARQVTELRAAVSLIGANLVQTLAIAGSSRLLDGTGGLPHAREHAIRTACAARLLAARCGLGDADAFAAGLLHDIGEMLLWHRDPERYSEAYAGWSDTGAQLRGERGLFGADHATAAREQLADWGLPGAVVDAVGDHHRPDLNHFDLSTLLAAAEELVDSGEIGTDRLATLGFAPDDLEGLCSEVAAQSAELSAVLQPS